MVQSYMKGNTQYGFELPIVSPAFRYVKRVLNDIEGGFKGITEIPKTAEELAKKGVGSAGLILSIVAVGIAGYLIFVGKKGTKLTP